MTYEPAYIVLERKRDEKIRAWIKQLRDHEEWRRSTGRTTTPWTDDQIAGEVATYLVDDDVARGEYEGCSVELELAYGEHCSRVERVLREDAK